MFGKYEVFFNFKHDYKLKAFNLFRFLLFMMLLLEKLVPYTGEKTEKKNQANNSKTQRQADRVVFNLWNFLHPFCCECAT